MSIAIPSDRAHKQAPPMVEADAANTGTPADLDTAWRELRADDDIQFSEVPAVPTPPQEVAEPRASEPNWLTDFFDWLESLFAPLGRALVVYWPILQWVLLAAGIVLIAYILFRVFGPDLAARRSRPGAAEEWTPDAEAAIALLDEADQLAAEGRFDEAVHLLLQRSVGQIAVARPDLVEPSSTAREIAVQPALPEKARAAFSIIAQRVERSLFALRRLTGDDWLAAREAYAEFALAHHGLRT